MLHTQAWLDLVNESMASGRFDNYPLYNSLIDVRAELNYMLKCDNPVEA